MHVQSGYSLEMLAMNRPTMILTLATLAGLVACATAPAPPLETAAPEYAGTPTKVKDEGAMLTFERIEGYLAHRGSNVRHPRPGVWHVSIDGIILMTIADEDRIRIIAPIFSLEQLDNDPAIQHAVLRRLLQANFDQSADARYAIFDGIVFATLTSPRTIVHESDLDRFVTQIVNLHKNTFRTGRKGYSSDDPDPNSIEIDPRKDDSLDLPQGYNRRDLPSPVPSTKRETISL